MIWLNDTVRLVNEKIGTVIAIDLKGRYTVRLQDGSVVQNLKHKDMKKWN